jgi:ectoine hydroxylase
MSEPYRLSASELMRLNEDGYVVREGVFSPDECARMAGDVEQLERDCLAAKRHTKHLLGSYMFEVQRQLQLAVKWEPQNPDVVQGIEPFAHISAPLKNWAHDPRLWNPSKDVVGQDDLGLFTEKTTMKRAQTGGTIVLHQDYPYWRNMTKVAHKVMTALIYLDDATVENGCLEVSPGSHRDGMRMGRKMADGFGANELDEAKFDMHTLIPVEAAAGTVVFFGAFLVHRSLPNRSVKDRRALLYSYQPAGYPAAVEINRLLMARAADTKAAQ